MAIGPPELPRTPIDWPILPSGFRDILNTVSKRYGLPIYVTENGLGADEQPDATPSVPGALSGKVRRQVMLVAFIAVRRLA